MAIQASFRVIPLLAMALASGACGGGSTNQAPVAAALSVAGLEDQLITGQLVGSDPEGKPLKYILVSRAHKGQVWLDSTTGAFSYTPDADAYGADSFSYVISDGKRQSVPAVVNVDIAPVNDAPTLGVVAEARNSAETLQVRIPLNAVDVDGDLLSISANARDPEVIRVVVDDVGAALLATPLKRGVTSIDVTVSDGALAASATVRFEVGDALKRREWVVEKPRHHVIEMTNAGSQPVSFRLRHNGHEMLRDLSDAVREVEALTGQFPDEPVEQLLWRYVKDGTYHWYPVTGLEWAHDPIVMLNSIGYGFCDDVAAVLATLAPEMGGRGRVWALGGHVVPELEFDGTWRMLDPDLGVYYRDANGVTVGVADLVAAPELITAPFDPVIQPHEDAHAYSSTVAEIYASSGDNSVHTDGFVGTSRLSGEVSLPPGATFSYPGHWVDAPVGVDGQMLAPNPAPASAQARLQLPAGFSGPVRKPFVLWSAAGQGVVRLSGVDYLAESPELATRLRSLEAQPEDVEVTAIGDVVLYYLLNPVRFSLRDTTILELEALDAWAVQVVLVDLPEKHQVPHSYPAVMAR